MYLRKTWYPFYILFALTTHISSFQIGRNKNSDPMQLQGADVHTACQKWISRRYNSSNMKKRGKQSSVAWAQRFAFSAKVNSIGAAKRSKKSKRLKRTVIRKLLYDFSLCCWVRKNEQCSFNFAISTPQSLVILNFLSSIAWGACTGTLLNLENAPGMHFIEDNGTSSADLVWFRPKLLYQKERMLADDCHVAMRFAKCLVSWT